MRKCQDFGGRSSSGSFRVFGPQHFLKLRRALRFRALWKIERLDGRRDDDAGRTFLPPRIPYLPISPRSIVLRITKPDISLC